MYCHLYADGIAPPLVSVEGAGSSPGNIFDYHSEYIHIYVEKTLKSWNYKVGSKTRLHRLVTIT